MKLVRLIVLAAGALLAGIVQAQSWPQKPVKFIVPFPPGGATDISARLLGQQLQEIWGQTVVIENRGGAGGGVGATEAARATPDGYTLFFPSGSVVTANQHVYAKLGYDPVKDFLPVTKVVSGPQVLVVNANSPYKTVQDLINAAKAQPGRLNFGHAGIGSQTHLAAENFVSSARIDALHVPYKGEGPALAGDELWLRGRYQGDTARLEYSLDGRTYLDTGVAFPLRFGHWKGARFGIFSYGRDGHVDVDYLRYRYGDPE